MTPDPTHISDGKRIGFKTPKFLILPKLCLKNFIFMTHELQHPGYLLE